MKHSFKLTSAANFIRDPEYLFHIPGILERYEEKSPCRFEIIIDENVGIADGMSKRASYEFSDDQKECVIYLPINLFRDRKSGKISAPGSASFFQVLRFTIEKGIKLYHERNADLIDCDACKGTGFITTIHDTQANIQGELITLSSEKGPREKCYKCNGLGKVKALTTP